MLTQHSAVNKQTHTDTINYCLFFCYYYFKHFTLLSLDFTAAVRTNAIII